MEKQYSKASRLVKYAAGALIGLSSLLPSGLEKKCGLGPSQAKAEVQLYINSDIYANFADTIYGDKITPAVNTINWWYKQHPGTAEDSFKINVLWGGSGFNGATSNFSDDRAIWWDEKGNSSTRAVNISVDGGGWCKLLGTIDINNHSTNLNLNYFLEFNVVGGTCIKIEGSASGNYGITGSTTKNEKGEIVPASSFLRGNTSIDYDGTKGANLSVSHYMFWETPEWNLSNIVLNNLRGRVDISENTLLYSDRAIVVGEEVAGASPVLNILNNNIKGFSISGLEFKSVLNNTTGKVENNSITDYSGVATIGIDNLKGVSFKSNNIYVTPPLLPPSGGSFLAGGSEEPIPEGNFSFDPLYSDAQFHLEQLSQMRGNGKVIPGKTYLGAPDIGMVDAYDIPGDADCSGMVNVDDLGILATNYDGTEKNWREADFTLDGLVNVDDLGVLASHYGEGSGGAGSGIPEPVTAALILAGVPLILARRKFSRLEKAA